MRTFKRTTNDGITMCIIIALYGVSYYDFLISFVMTKRLIEIVRHDRSIEKI